MSFVQSHWFSLTQFLIQPSDKRNVKGLMVKGQRMVDGTSKLCGKYRKNIDSRIAQSISFSKKQVFSKLLFCLEIYI